MMSTKHLEVPDYLSKTRRPRSVGNRGVVPKTGAAWALHDMAKGTPQQNTGDLVWECEGVLPLVAMLAPADSPQAIAAATAISQLASPINKAFQVRWNIC